MKVFLPGGAGLVGLNLIQRILEAHSDWEILVVDKKLEAIKIGKRLFPKVKFLCENLTFKGNQTWYTEILNYDCCVLLQAEIGNLDTKQFELNNVLSTRVILNEIKKSKINRIVHISSSVVNSFSKDIYTETKIKQEKLVLKEFPKAIVLRPTLMFGWFDRKHLGWLYRFMRIIPIFPIPGFGRFKRQPLFVGDFCKIILSSIEDKSISGIFNISGLEKIDYIDLMSLLKTLSKSKTIFINLPIPLFALFLKIWSFISAKPAFTTSQLQALTAGDEFEVIDWPKIFSVKNTSLNEALNITFKNSLYSGIFIPF